MLKAAMSPEALERLYRIQVVKPQNFEMLKGHILKQVQGGALREKISEGQVISMLEMLSEKKQETTITFKRRKSSSDEDD